MYYICIISNPRSSFYIDSFSATPSRKNLEVWIFFKRKWTKQVKIWNIWANKIVVIWSDLNFFLRSLQLEQPVQEVLNTLGRRYFFKKSQIVVNKTVLSKQNKKLFKKQLEKNLCWMGYHHLISWPSDTPVSLECVSDSVVDWNRQILDKCVIDVKSCTEN